MEYFFKVLKYHYADFNGRARRKEYWMFTLVAAGILITICILATLLSPISTILSNIIIISGVFFSLIIIIPSIALITRRMHDIGKSGWYIFIPFYNIILTFIEGDIGENKYGTDPKAREHFIL
ncbi:MAG: DUF805 domain-containing protein [Prevotella sp.]|jgi:uncharacterized membrane protein YhaH (DUF805 family)|nr:DUF805 domain-containing protein [Prevotella sp.]